MSRWASIRDRIVHFILEQIGYYDCPSMQGDATSSAPSAETPEDRGAEGGGWTASAPGGADDADGAEFNSLLWTWGGFDGHRAAPVAGCRVKALKVSSDGLSFKWASGGCEQLGASSASDYSQTLACLFCHINGKWRGGKLDWISTSRKSRSFDNIFGGYHGWPRNAVHEADRFAFVIVGRDGKRRTNVITCKK